VPDPATLELASVRLIVAVSPTIPSFRFHVPVSVGAGLLPTPHEKTTTFRVIAHSRMTALLIGGAMGNTPDVTAAATDTEEAAGRGRVHTSAMSFGLASGNIVARSVEFNPYSFANSPPSTERYSFSTGRSRFSCSMDSSIGF